MKKLVLVYIVLIIAVILLAVFKGGGDLLSFIPSFGKKATAEANGQKINLLIAKSPSDRIKGLSGRKSLAQNQGMLFIFEKKGIYPFWMKDALISLDIIWIDENTVVYIVENTTPKSFTRLTPDREANYVLELNGGQANKLKIQKGTKITFKGL